MPKTQTLGKRLANERRRKAYEEERDIDKTDVAEAVGTTHSSISRYENDVSKPDDAMLQKLADFYGVTRSWIRFGEGERRPVTTEREVVKPESTARSAKAASRRKSR